MRGDFELAANALQAARKESQLRVVATRKDGQSIPFPEFSPHKYLRV
jgi:hypothetical protein